MARPARSTRLQLPGLGVLLLLGMVWLRLLGHDGQAWRGVIDSDGAGYFAYHARAMGMDSAAYPIREDHVVPAGEGTVIKYMVGAPLMQAPFVAVAHAAGRIAGSDPDPKAFRYALALALAGVWWAWLGLACLRRLLLDMGLPGPAVGWTLAVVLMGTGLFHHAVISPAMSHPYAFAAIATFLLAAWRAWYRGGMGWTIAAAGLFALVLLIRPVNGIVLLALPILAWKPGVDPRAWWQHTGRRAWWPAALVFLLVVAPQPLAWWWQSGQWIVRPYAGEGFLWCCPQLWKSLFGAQKGLFFHWPLLLLAVAGLWPLWRRSALSASGVMLHAAALIYLTSAWWSWEYGDTYGPRPYLDHLAVAALPIACLFTALHNSPWWKARWLVVPLLALQLFQGWQYTAGIIHPHNMDREKWRAIFLRTDPAWRGAMGGTFGPPPFAPCGLDTLLVTTAWPGHMPSPWESGADILHFGDAAFFRVGDERPFGPTLRLGPDDLPTGQAFHVEGWLRRGEMRPGSSRDAVVVGTLGPPGTTRVYHSFRLNDIPDAGTWRRWRHAFRLPPALPGEQLSWYVWQPGQGEFLLDSIHLVVRSVRPCP